MIDKINFLNLELIVQIPILQNGKSPHFMAPKE